MASVGQTIGNLVKCCIGVGIVTLPLTFLESGFIVSTAMTIILGLWMYYCMLLLIKSYGLVDALIPTDEDPYVSVARRGLGKWGPFIINFCFIVTLVGVGGAYAMLFKDNLGELPWQDWGIPIKKEQSWIFAIVFCIIGLPLVLLRSMKSLSYVSQSGNYLLAISVFVILGYGIYEYGFSWNSSSLMPSVPSSIANLFGTLCFSLGVAFISLSSRSSMKEPTKFSTALIASLCIPSLTYIIVSIVAATTYADKLEANIMINLPDASWMNIVCVLCLGLMSYFSFPIALFPAVGGIESLIKDKNGAALPSETKTFVSNPKRLIVRGLLTIISAVIAVFVKRIGDIVSLIGCLTISMVSFIVPPLLHYKLCAPKPAQKAIDVILIVLGFGVMLFTTTMTIIGMTKKK